jgi:hypothetical protein
MAELNVLLTTDEIDSIVRQLQSDGHGKDGGDYEPECPTCAATDKLKALLARGEKEPEPVAWIDPASLEKLKQGGVAVVSGTQAGGDLPLHFTAGVTGRDSQTFPGQVLLDGNEP